MRITTDSHSSDFAPLAPDSVFPILGIRIDPNDGSIWANSWEEKPAANKSQVLHVSGEGKILARFAPTGTLQHGLNDLVVLKSGEVFTTDSTASEVYRLDPATNAFAPLKFHRQLFYPNGIALAGDERTLYVADSIGVIRYDLARASSEDVSRPHVTLAGADGLPVSRNWWCAKTASHPGVAMFKLSSDGAGFPHYHSGVSHYAEHAADHRRDPWLRFLFYFQRPA